MGKIYIFLTVMLLGSLATADLSRHDMEESNVDDYTAQINGLDDKVENLSEKMENMAKDFDNLSGKMENMAKDFDNLTKTVENWAAKMKDLATKMDRFYLMLTEQKDEMVSTNDVKQLISIDPTVTTLRDQAAYLTNWYEPLHDQYSQLENQVQELISKKPHDVAFYAAFSKGVENITKGAVIPFDNVLLNQGNSYSKTTYTYTCDVPGNYFFTYSLVCDRNCLAIMKHKHGSDQYNRLTVQSLLEVRNQLSSSGVFHCDLGDSIWIQADVYDSMTLAGYSRHSSFSGFLITKD